jgi:sialic acid synthase SpsE
VTELALGNVIVGDGRRPVLIAEAACEHLGRLDLAKQLVDAAAEAGADVVKFQLHVPEEMVAGSIQFWGGSMDDVLARYNLGPKDQERLMAYCGEVGIQYLCTPFSARAVEILDGLGVAAFKTGSGELTNIPMLRAIAATGKPVVVSTGMATMEEIDESVAVLREEGASFMLTHCTSAYPPGYDELNLGLIPVLRERYGVLVGYSDHTAEPWSTVAAVALGARLVEKHFTLDRDNRGPDWHVSLEPAELAQVAQAIAKVDLALGAEKRVQPGEEAVREWAHHSIVAARPIAAGEELTREALAVKRPGNGIPSKHLEELVGRRATRDLAQDQLLGWDDVAR